jgi:hypothetical protein
LRLVSVCNYQTKIKLLLIWFRSMDKYFLYGVQIREVVVKD